MVKPQGKIKYVKVQYTNGKKMNTSCNPNLSNKEVRSYFKVGRVVNIGRGENDRMTKIKKVSIYRNRVK